METVKVNRVQVYPCAYWKGLVKRTNIHPDANTCGFTRGTWPPRSSILCWSCCHTFDNVPAFYPVELDLDRNTFYFIGNFCSWNCVKAYSLKLNDNRRPPGASYTSLLAFLTVHRPRNCPNPTSNPHKYSCPCLEKFTGVQMPPKRENLQMFGGGITISEYRKDFLVIEDYAWVTNYFHNNDSMHRDMDQLMSTPKSRAYTFCFVSYPGPAEATVDQLYVLPLTKQTLPKAQPTEKKEVAPKSCARSNPGGRRRFPKNNTPTVATNDTSATTPTRVEPVVSEEQAFYVSSVCMYGNLINSMGITVKSKKAEN